MKMLLISEREAGQRLDRFLGRYMDRAPASFLYKMLRKKNITLNGHKADGSERLAEGDSVKLFLSEETITKMRKERTTPDAKGPALSKERILYEDGDVLLYNKESGLLVQKGRAEDLSLADLLPAYLIAEGRLTDEDLRAFRPAPAMRLDRNTSGIVLCGNSLCGLQELSRMIRERSIRKEYLALVCGIPFGEGHIRAAFKKDERQNMVKLRLLDAGEMPKENEELCESIFRIRKTGREVSLVEAELLSGKPHQLRAQLAALGSPILGDPKYGKRGGTDISRKAGARTQHLHAYRVCFPEDTGRLPALGGRSFEAPLPDDFRKAMKQFLHTEQA